MSSTEQLVKMLPLNQKVWETLSDFSLLNETVSRRVCNQFHEADPDTNPKPDELSVNHCEYLVGMIETLEMTEIRRAILNENEEIHIEEANEDPFYYAEKVDKNKIMMYLSGVKGTEGDVCAICRDGPEEPVRLSCRGHSCLFCKECISEWITKYNARCPSCRRAAEPIVAPIVKVRAVPKPLVNSKRKVVITIRAKETKQ